MLENLAFVLIQRVAIIIMAIYTLITLFTRKKYIFKLSNLKITIGIGLIGGFLGIVGTYLGLEYKSAITNYRDMGVIIAGLLGGPVSGTIAGLIAGIHRMTFGGITGISCSIATIIVGISTGFLRKKFGSVTMRPHYAAPITVAMELFHLGLVYLATSPKTVAVDIVSTVLFPMVLGNSIGVFILAIILRNIQIERDNLTDTTIKTVFAIVEETIGVMDKGLNMETAKQICETIKRWTSFDAIAITSRERILSHVGIGDDHHKPGSTKLTESTRIAIQRGKARYVKHKSTMGCENPACPLFRCVIIPIKFTDGETIGTLKLYKEKDSEFENHEINFAKGLGQILSIELELAQANREARNSVELRYRQLVTKTDPHFLFNTLNALAFLTKRNPENARRMVLQLSEMLRYSLREQRNKVPLSDELLFTQNYLQLMKIRYGERLNYRLEKQTNKDFFIPPFTIQPLVENAIKHGMSSENPLNMRIIIKEERDKLKIKVKDDGLGMKDFEKTRNGIGSELIIHRLKKLYGNKGKLFYETAEKKGTCAIVHIPVQPVDESEKLLESGEIL